MVIDKIKQRMTPQRQLILNYLKGVKTHPSAEMIFSAVREDMSNITLATVYRNLNLLVDNGEVLKLTVNGEARFDCDVSAHQHCYCECCGKVIDLFSKRIDNYAAKKMELDGFDLKRVHVVFYGRCKSCKEVKKDGRSS